MVLAGLCNTTYSKSSQREMLTWLLELKRSKRSTCIFIMGRLLEELSLISLNPY